MDHDRELRPARARANGLAEHGRAVHGVNFQTAPREFERGLAAAAPDIANALHLREHGAQDVSPRVTVHRRGIPAQDVIVTSKKRIGRIDRTIRRRRGRAGIDCGLEPISTPRKRLDESRCRRRVAKRLAQPFDRRVQAVLEIDEGIVAPEFTTQIVARHQCAGRAHQERENAKRLDWQEEPAAVLRQLPRPEIQRELTESHELRVPLDWLAWLIPESGVIVSDKTLANVHVTLLSPSYHRPVIEVATAFTVTSRHAAQAVAQDPA